MRKYILIYWNNKFLPWNISSYISNCDFYLTIQSFFLRTVRDNFRIMIVFHAFQIFHFNSEIFLRILSLHFTTVFAHKELCNLHYNLTIVTFFSVYIWQISEIMASRNPEFTSFSLNLFQNSKLISQFLLIYSDFTFTFMHLADAFIQSDLQLHSGYTFLISICVPWESNLQPFALLTQCSTTEPHRKTVCFTEFCEKSQNCEINSQNLHLAI